MVEPRLHPYRTAAIPHAHVTRRSLDWRWNDRTRNARRRGIALVAMCGVCSAALVVVPFAAPRDMLGFAWLVTAVAQIVFAWAGADVLLVVRRNDRTRAQRLCAAAAGIAIVLGAVTFAVLVLVAFVAMVVALSGPWCGVCGT